MIKSITVKNYLNESLTIELTRPEKSGFIVKDITGLGPDKADINIMEIASRDGGAFNSARKNTRNIVMQLLFTYDPTLTDVGLYSIEDCRHRSYKYFPLKKNVTLTFLTDNREVKIDGYVESNEPDIFSQQEGCQISILCTNPYFRKNRNEIIQRSGHREMFEFPFSNELIPFDDFFSTIFYTNSPVPDGHNAYLKFKIGMEIRNKKMLDDFLSNYYSNCSVVVSLGCKILYANNDFYKTASDTYISEDFFELVTIQVNNGIIKITEHDDHSASFNINDWVDKNNFVERYYMRMHLRMVGDFITKDADRQKFLTEIFQVKIYDIYTTIEDQYRMEVSFMKHEDITLDINQLSYNLHCFYSNEDVYNLTRNTSRNLNISLLYDKIEESGDYLMRSGNSSFIDISMNKIDINLYSNYIKKIEDDEYMTLEFKIITFYPSETIDYNTPINSESMIKTFINFDSGLKNLAFSIDGLSLCLEGFKESESFLKEIYRIDIDSLFSILYEQYSRDNDRVTVKTGLINKSNGYLVSIRIPNNIANELFSADYLEKSEIKSPTFQLLFLNRTYLDGEKKNIFNEKTNIYIGFSITDYNVYHHIPRKNKSGFGNYLIDRDMPNYTFEKDGKTYNLQISEGIEFGKVETYMFPVAFPYEGAGSSGFIMTVEFSHNLVSDESVGYIVIRNPRYFNKKIAINLDEIETILDISVGEIGDILTIDTRRGKKNVYYQKPTSEKYNDKTNVLFAVNKDRQWFEIDRGYNEFQIYHTFYPENITISEDERDKVHADYLDVEINVEVLYEGV